SWSWEVRTIRTFIWAPLRGRGGQKSLTRTRSRAHFLTLRRVRRGDKFFAMIQALTWIAVIGPSGAMDQFSMDARADDLSASSCLHLFAPCRPDRARPPGTFTSFN